MIFICSIFTFHFDVFLSFKQRKANVFQTAEGGKTTFLTLKPLRNYSPQL